MSTFFQQLPTAPPEEPFLVAFSKNLPGPQYPISESGQNLLRCFDRLFDLLPSCGTKVYSASEAIPATLPAIPLTGGAEVAGGVKF